MMEGDAASTVQEKRFTNYVKRKGEEAASANRSQGATNEEVATATQHAQGMALQEARATIAAEKAARSSANS